MVNSTEDAHKKPPRRLFSFDSIKSSSPSPKQSYEPPPKRVHIQRLPQLDERASEDSSSNGAPGRFANRAAGLVGPRPQGNNRPPPLNTNLTVDTSNGATDAPPPSPSRIRWEQLRQQVLVPAPPSQSPASFVASPQSFIPSGPPTRSQTPKPSKLGRFGFRQVVEHVRDMSDDSRRFASDIQRACWAARYPELHKSKSDKDPHNTTMGSSLHLPFMASSMGNGAGNAHPTATSNQMNMSNKKQDVKRPQSVQSLAMGSIATPSLKQLYQTLLQYSTITLDGFPPSSTMFPHEIQVLSTLLTPFSGEETSSRLEEERWYAVESFGIVMKTWFPSDEGIPQAMFVERCLWCCEAASNVVTPLRPRIIKMLWDILVPVEHRTFISKPLLFQTVAQGLFNILPLSQLRYGQEDEESKLIKEMINKMNNGSVGEFNTQAIEEEYSALCLDDDEPAIVRHAIMLEALARVLANSPMNSHQWFMQFVLEVRHIQNSCSLTKMSTAQEFWVVPKHNTAYTPLLSAIYSRILTLFTHASLRYIATGSVSWAAKATSTKYILHYLQTRVLPILDIIKSKSTMDARSHVVRLTWNLLNVQDGDPLKNWATSLISRWYKHSAEWKTAFGETLRQFVMTGDWPSVIPTLACLIKNLADDVRPHFTAFILPVLNDQLVDDPPPYPCPPLTQLLDHISRAHPHLFFKPIFSCAAGLKEYTVVNHLCALSVLSRFLPDFWTRDAEMVAIAVMSDVGGGGNSSNNNGGLGSATLSPTGLSVGSNGTNSPRTPDKFSAIPYATPRLGQSVLLVELIGRVHAIRHAKDSNSRSESTYKDELKFFLSLEMRLAILLEARERTILVPFSQRLLFCILLREIRLLTRSLKPAAWLPKVVSWFITYLSDDDVIDEADEELQLSIGQLQGLYIAAQDGVRSSQKRRTTMIFSPRPDASFENIRTENATTVAGILEERSQLLKSLSKGFIPKAIKLLIAASSLLTTDDYKVLAPQLWYRGLTDIDISVVAPVCFLLMQCAERNPLDVLALIEVDLQSLDDNTRLEAVRKISVLTNWRFQVLSQHIVTDRAHRPFKLTRIPLPFVATDVGSNHHVLEDDPTEVKDNMPLELRQRLADIGWTQDDLPVDQQSEWIRTPMSLLPVHQLDRLDDHQSQNIVSAPTIANAISQKSENAAGGGSATQQEEPGLLRRNSSTGGPIHGVRRRAIFVPALSPAFLRLSKVMFDPNYAVASAARMAIMDLMRNDPALLTRPALDLLVGETKDLSSAISTLRSFLHVYKVTPPPMAHYMFNNLAGFLKYAARQVENRETLRDYSLTVPVLSELAMHVSGMSLREIKKAKLDVFLIPSGSLWFGHTAPPGPMFPRNMGMSGPGDIIPPNVAAISMIRLSQNMLFLSMLKKNQQEVQLVRKNMSRFVLPSLEHKPEPPLLTLKDFIPQRQEHAAKALPIPEWKLAGLSMLLSRSYLLLIAQVFRSMSRHLSDRHELSILIDGLNRILLTHGRDVGIVAQALIALMVASTRFRRLFMSGGGYTLFMPAVIRIYAESESHSGIRLAIEYAVNRFYAFHKEAFVFQALDVVAQMTMLPGCDADWLARSVYTLFSSLRKGISPSTADAAGIHHVNQLQEREAMMFTTAEEKPQTFLAMLRRTDSSQPQNLGIGGLDSTAAAAATAAAAVASALPEEYEGGRLSMDDFVKLFLTVIAHDPTIPRAENFMKLLRYLSPYLYNTSISARTVLQEGIDALGQVLTRAGIKTKGTADHVPSGKSAAEEINMKSSSESGTTGTGSGGAGGLGPQEKVKGMVDPTSMRLDFLELATSYTRAGGLFPQPSYTRIIDFAKSMIRDSSQQTVERISKFFADLTRTTLIREQQPSTKTMVLFLRHIALVVNTYGATLDLAGVFEIIVQFAAVPHHANDTTFARVVVTQYCVPGLSSWEQANTGTVLLDSPFRKNLVALLVHAVLFHTEDIISELLKRPPSYEYLAGIILPFAMSLRTFDELASSGVRQENWHRGSVVSAWIRLLEYATVACESSSQRTIERSKDKRRSADSKNATVPIFLLSIQLLKIVIIRAQTELSNCIPGIWNRLGTLLRTVLAEGDANFAVQPTESSPNASPSPSPRASVQFDHSMLSSTPPHFRDPGLGSFKNPRIVDYACWSLLAWLCTYKTPLILQMRLYMVERVVTLDNKLQSQSILLTSSPGARRISTSIFSKSRRRRSGLPSPEASPQISASPSYATTSFAYENPSFLSIDGRQPGYQNFLSSPTKQDRSGPRIVHLGPVSNPFPFRRPGDTGTTSGSTHMVKLLKIKSPTLVEATYHRVRLIQAFLGYQTLLPLPNDPHNEQVHMTTLTKHQVLEALTKEIRDLLEEFDVSYRPNDDDVAIADAI
ncbi:hypothetical protein BDN72DRAFT_957330 [Pluteus cervinus]|uniref:Uncharacterized protein n=1 Tax=Pluteus cervinus TaxID=181527 RepID=A0ACD3B374_9AGAR|nr:hypothetical protein BDN72DRAFT_957330 [Pluteus cervinus]